MIFDTLKKEAVSLANVNGGNLIKVHQLGGEIIADIISLQYVVANKDGGEAAHEEINYQLIFPQVPVDPVVIRASFSANGKNWRVAEFPIKDLPDFSIFNHIAIAAKHHATGFPMCEQSSSVLVDAVEALRVGANLKDTVLFLLSPFSRVCRGLNGFADRI